MEAAREPVKPAAAAAAVEVPKPTGLTAVNLWLVCACFIASGACGLAYEVVWSKYLGLFLGNTVLVHTAVLGVFMGGMAAGSFLSGRFADRIASPLKAYGWIELAVAGYAFAFPVLADAAQNAVVSAAGTLPPGSAGLLAVRIGLATLLLIVPTMLMGGTFPFLTAHLERSAGRGAGGANWLYFANCSGAVLGTLLTGFFLIPSLGLYATVQGVAIANSVIGILCLGAGSAFGTLPVTAVSTGPRTTAQNRTRRLVLAAIFLSGAAAFTYELVWTRLFAVTLGSSTYSFTLMLAAFISGLALGSIAADRLPGVKRAPLTWFAIAEVLIALTIALSIPLYPRLPYWSWVWKWMLRPVEESIGLFYLAQYGLTFAVMAVPTFLFGLTFPTAIRAACSGDDHEEIGAHAAAVYGWNTIGTLVGVTLAGFALIPLLGLRGTLICAAAVNLGIGLLLILGESSPASTRKLVMGISVASALVLIAAPSWHPMSFTFGAYRGSRPAPESWKAYQQMIFARKPVFYKEDQGATVAVLPSVEPQTGQEQLGLVVDGKADATSVGDMPTQVLLAQIPMLLRPESRDVFILGLGSGVTAGSVLKHPVDRVDCVEISRAVAEASKQFGAANGNALADPRLHLLIEDGKTALAASRRKYDVIISEPTNPWISGVGNLFSQESFVSAARALKPGGLVAQWFHAYEMDDPLVATIIRTFRSVFPHVVLFQGCETDYILIGSLDPIAPDFARMQERLQTDSVRKDLERIHITRVASLLARQSHGEAQMPSLQEGGGLNGDDLPLLEYLAPRALYTGATAGRVRSTDGRLQPGSGLLIERYAREHGLNRADYAEITDQMSDRRMSYPEFRAGSLRRYLEQWPADAGRRLQLARALREQGSTREAAGEAARAARDGSAEARRFETELLRELETQPQGRLPFAY